MEVKQDDCIMLAKIETFKGKDITKIYDYDEKKWWFSMTSIVGILKQEIGITINDPRKYWYKTQERLERQNIDLSPNKRPIYIANKKGKKVLYSCLDLEGLFKVLQAYTHPGVAPIKEWLAKVGAERIREEMHPDLIADRFIKTKLKQGWTLERINLRFKGKLKRVALTEYWRDHGVKGKEYAYLTAEGGKRIFGMIPSKHSEFKELEKGANLRDHMSETELSLQDLHESSVKMAAETKRAEGLEENMDIVKGIGDVMGETRKKLEKEIGKPIVTKEKKLLKK